MSAPLSLVIAALAALALLVGIAGAQSAQPTASPSCAIPTGTFDASCTGCTANCTLLTCATCTNVLGQQVPASLSLPCGGDIHNVNGTLVCFTNSPTTALPTFSPSTSHPSRSPTHSPATSRPSHSPTSSPTCGIPTGTFDASCTGCTANCTLLTCATCTNVLGQQVPASLSLPCGGDIHNVNGTLVCFTNSPTTALPTFSPSTSHPSHSPTHSPSTSHPSKSPTRSPTHSPTTSHPSGAPSSSHPSHSPTTDRPSRSPTSSPTCSVPTGTYDLSCGGCTANCTLLTCALCTNIAGQQVPASINLPCPGDIHNVNGTLVCFTGSPTTLSPTTHQPSHSPTRPTTTSPTSAHPTSSAPSHSPSSSHPSQSPTSAHPSASPHTSKPSWSPTLAPSTSTPSHSPSSSPTCGVPSGTYHLSCTGCTANCTLLSCTACTNIAGQNVSASEPLPCFGDIHNVNGTLVCFTVGPTAAPTHRPSAHSPSHSPTHEPTSSKPSHSPTSSPTCGVPTGTFDQSCTGCSANCTLLVCTACTNIAGQNVFAAEKLPCFGDIHNVNGTLVCFTAGPTGSPSHHVITHAPTHKPTLHPTAISSPPTTRTPSAVPTTSPVATPTTSPIGAPTAPVTSQPSMEASPTGYPTTYPTEFAPGPNLDVYFILDQSRSISNANPLCNNQQGLSCWVMSINFIDLTQKQLAARVGGYYNPQTGHGLRVYISTFTCLNLQPLYKVHLQLDGDQVQIENILGMMRGMTPLYGTCPSAGLKDIRQSIAAHRSDVRFNQAVTVISDGRVSEIDINPTIKTSYNILLTGGQMWAAAVGQGIDMAMLVKICNGVESRVVQVNDYLTLASALPPDGGAYRVAYAMDLHFGLSASLSSSPTASPFVNVTWSPTPTSGAPSSTSAPSPSSAVTSYTPKPTAARAPSQLPTTAQGTLGPAVGGGAPNPGPSPTLPPSLPSSSGQVSQSPTTSPSQNLSSSTLSSSNLPSIADWSVASGTFAGLAAFSALGFFLYRRRRQYHNPNQLAFSEAYNPEDQIIVALPEGPQVSPKKSSMRRRSRGPDIERGLPLPPMA